MVSLFSGLNIASSALKVNESAISVVSHNVANMNTEGYSKQKVNLAARNIAGTIGNSVDAQIRSNGGVMISEVMRYNNDYLNNYYRSQLSDLNKYNQQVGDLGNLADIFNDLDDNGISSALSSFYDALNNLQEYPANSTARTNFIENAKTLTAVLNSKSKQLEQLKGNDAGDGVSDDALKSSELYTKIEELNAKLNELAQVNKSLQMTQTGTLTANNLLDKRDLILNEIAEYVDIDIKEAQNGSVTLYAGGTALVKGAEVKGELTVQTAYQYCIDNGMNYPDDWVDEDGNPRTDLAVVSIINNGTIINKDVNRNITSGSIGGMLNPSEGMTVAEAQQSLDLIANEIADMFNTLNKRSGAYHIDPNDTSKLSDSNKVDIFTIADGGGSTITAGNISVNPRLYANDGGWLISAAYFRDTDNFDVNAVGNAQNVGNSFVDSLGNPVGSFLGTRSEKRSNLNGDSLENYYLDFVGKIAAGSSNAQNIADTQADIVDSLENQIKANNSVNLDEELIDLVKYQTAYAASAQVFNVINNCLDTLMSLGR